METYGRERRHRYFTIATYKVAMTTENLQDAYAHDIDPLRIGEFAEIDGSLFYANDAQLSAYLESFDKGGKVHKGKQKEAVSVGSGGKRKRSSGEEEEEKPTRKRGRPRKTAVADSSQVPKKRGRPHKPSLPSGQEEQTPKKRGRPPKKTKASTTTRDEEEAPAAQTCMGVREDIVSQDVPMEEAVPVHPTMEGQNNRRGEDGSVGDVHSGEVDQSATTFQPFVAGSCATSESPIVSEVVSVINFPGSLWKQLTRPKVPIREAVSSTVSDVEVTAAVKPSDVGASTREVSPMVSSFLI